MSKPFWFPCYPSDFLHAMEGMSLEESGAYQKIILMLYECENALELERIEHPITGKLTGYSYKRLARRLNSRSDKVQRIVESLLKQQKLSLVSGYLTNRRVARELHKREMISKRNRDNVSKRRDRQNTKVIDFNKMRSFE